MPRKRRIGRRNFRKEVEAFEGMFRDKKQPAVVHAFKLCCGDYGRYGESPDVNHNLISLTSFRSQVKIGLETLFN
jgi:hypothetical protein